MNSPRTIRIGGACGFWGESAVATPQLLAAGGIDYIVYDYLAEITMSIMARARSADSAKGFAGDFVTAVLRPNLAEIASQRVRVISNAGGVNPQVCAGEIRAMIEEAGLELKVAVVTGDDLMDRTDEIAAAGPAEMFSGMPFPDVQSLASMNAYLGAFPIARALDLGADIVITGRVVDSAVTLGACIHEFGWGAADLDLLAAGSLAGHLLECGPQATGGNFTDWELVAESYADIGYPIIEITAQGEMVCTKPLDSGGLVSPHTVCEQMLYEIGDPGAYVLPDVSCDFTRVEFEQVGENRVAIRGARGNPRPESLKVSATYADGYRGGQLWCFYGEHADRKARRFAEVALQRTAAALARGDMAGFSETCVELIGDESHYGARRAVTGSREVALKIAARHEDARGLNMLFRETVGMALGAPPGLTGFAGTRPKPSPVVRLFSFQWPRTEVPVAIEFEERSVECPHEPAPTSTASPTPASKPPQPPEVSEALVNVPLLRLALGRSGDKGDKANIGIICRRPEFLPWIWAVVDEEKVAEAFAHFLNGNVERFYLPGCNAINFLLHDVLGGGGMASLRNDPQGKGYAQLLLDLPVSVPATMAEAL